MDERYRVQSVGRAMDLLDRIAESGRDGARLTDLARLVGLSKPATHAMLSTLSAGSLVAGTGEGQARRYRLGLGLIRLGDQAVSNTDVADAALPALRDLTRGIGMTSRVAVMDGGFAAVVGRVDAPGAVRFDAALGQREMPHCSGLGKVLLAAMPRPEALALLRQVGRPARTKRTLTTLKALEEDLDRIAARHYALDDEEDHAGIICVAAALFGHGGRTAGAISVTTLKQLLPSEAVQGIATHLISAADRISLALGGPSAAAAWDARR